MKKLDGKLCLDRECFEICSILMDMLNYSDTGNFQCIYLLHFNTFR